MILKHADEPNQLYQRPLVGVPNAREVAGAALCGPNPYPQACPLPVSPVGVVGSRGLLQGPCQHTRVAVKRLGSCAVCAEDDLILMPKKVVLGLMHPTRSLREAVAQGGAFRRLGVRADPEALNATNGNSEGRSLGCALWKPWVSARESADSLVRTLVVLQFVSWCRL